jgi:hypothetical protein
MSKRVHTVSGTTRRQPVKGHIIILDFEKKTVSQVGTNPSIDKALAAALAAQKSAVLTASGTPRPADAG